MDDAIHTAPLVVSPISERLILRIVKELQMGKAQHKMAIDPFINVSLQWIMGRLWVTGQRRTLLVVVLGLLLVVFVVLVLLSMLAMAFSFCN